MAVRKIDWEKIDAEIESANKKNEKPVREKKVDENLYRYKTKNGESIVLGRFLPQRVDDIDLPYAAVLQHSYESKDKKLLLEKCPRTLRKTVKCPVCELGSKLFYGGDKELGKDLFFKAHYYMNFLVINDVNNPENNGKIFILKLDKNTFNNKIMSKINPSVEERELGTEPVRVFDYEKGMNFKLKISDKKIVIKGKNGAEDRNIVVPNYDASEWSNTITRISIDGKKPLTDEQIEELIEPNLIPLKPYMENGIKSYEDIKKRLDFVLGVTTEAPKTYSDGFEQSMSGSSRMPSGGSVDDDDDFLKTLANS